ncbi:unnamed protein product [Citrullus colocynthis]|uniref:SCP domain-containing protein n=1 Tax=Citrullus colocynthis TaxID=252529 RepID=A0ABP0Y9Q3_9ROSI
MAFANILSIICMMGLTLTLASITPILANSYSKNYIAAHNAIHAEVGIEPLRWNTTLAIYAQNYANTKITICQMEHARGPYGENLAEGYEMMTAETVRHRFHDLRRDIT